MVWILNKGFENHFNINMVSSGGPVCNPGLCLAPCCVYEIWMVNWMQPFIGSSLCARFYGISNSNIRIMVFIRWANKSISKVRRHPPIFLFPSNMFIMPSKFDSPNKPIKLLRFVEVVVNPSACVWSRKAFTVWHPKCFFRFIIYFSWEIPM